MDILDFLRSDGSIVVNKRLAHEIGTIEAIIYSELVSLYKYWSDRGQLTDGKWFFCTADNLEKNTALKRKPQDRSIAKLEKLGLIETKKMGLPARKYFYITDGIYNLFSSKTNKDDQNGQADNSGVSEAENIEKPRPNQVDQNGQTGLTKMDKLECPKGTANNTRTNNTNLNNKRERENIIKDAEIDQDLKDHLIKRSSDFETKGIDLQIVLNWIADNRDIYNYTEFVIGIDQLLDYPLPVEIPVSFLNTTFGRIEYYVELAKKKAGKKIDKQLSEEKRLQQQLNEAVSHTPKVEFYNWLEDRS